MNKLELIKTMVEESSSFTWMRVSDKETLTADVENYKSSVAKFMYRRLSGISL